MTVSANIIGEKGQYRITVKKDNHLYYVYVVFISNIVNIIYPDKIKIVKCLIPISNERLEKILEQISDDYLLLTFLIKNIIDKEINNKQISYFYKAV
ncbi:MULTISPECIES: hypothetical protein [Thermoanaerobacterium]|uniref:Uncharacterized protein n=3 Tax=Thermoanaerobacterium TaxID=28895 RepID=L0INR8_THETR|nr:MULTISPECIES: hypothetical protein [Thermoanaerobacterium]AFK94363.1 hypothetical protein Tsac_2816 [Thermoanaerobacterium saccharolyticum JW/SL-YS485]AGB20399.1 hypothetical protein Thethe_02848 [Thermoanaerobacterium thermosaccharolyticum M0795]ETO39133.1 hypothetical protein V518_0721 [Thermoanaerobacterium aotearoense SCUT27]